ncbi:MAG: leucyl/phenylalanyl-tRNA--protein transferase [Rhodospirillaceae bacterium]|nr:leucyl/phenylalanyl-tRNA--protein transferase [Rhodospirillaceae bacterium]
MEYRLTAELLLRAYTTGMFPMGKSLGDSDIVWVDPELRGILPLDRFYIPRRLRRTVRNRRFEIRADTTFTAVMKSCATPWRGRRDTWINTEILRAYAELHHLGFAHSVECWLEDDLVGGLYGVSIAGAFFGESMFTRKTDASKVALVHLVARLDHAGYRLLDIQFITDHLKQFGAVAVPRHEYRILLQNALAVNATFPVNLPEEALADYLQSFTHTS